MQPSLASALPCLFICLLTATISLLSVTAPRNFPCQAPHHNSYPFCNTSLPVSSRVQSLISLLTLEEKISQLCDRASEVPRLGIPAYNWWSESLHGIAKDGNAVTFNGSIKSSTTFPQVLLMAASFNHSLWFEVAKAIGVEGRAMYNEGQAGLTFWAPNVNIFRDPRWGRGQETPGEDPFVSAAYAVEFVKGFQRHDEAESCKKSKYPERSGGDLMLSACCKHFTAYDLEKWGNFTRYTFNAKVTKQDMEDTFQYPFRSCIMDGHASCLMCSDNQINGVPACAHKELIEQARNKWGFKGYITSDCDAVAVIHEYQHYAASEEDAVAMALKAGMDINCGTFLLRHTKAAVMKEKVNVKDIDRAVFNLFSIQLRLGFYNGSPLSQCFGNLGPPDVCTDVHKSLALEAARQGIVLLKNDMNFLPLNKQSTRTLALIGPAANDTSKLGGSYTGYSCNPVSLFKGLEGYVDQLLFTNGCINISCLSKAGFEQAIHIAQAADYVIVVAGLDLSQESEDLDRVSLLLPGEQARLICAIAGTSKRPIILLIMGGGPLDISFAKNDKKIASILWIGYPGEAGGQAVADVIFGDFNPGGRLPVTWYPELFARVAMNDMNMRANRSRGYPGRTYKFYTGETVYDFGHGLSFSAFSYKFISIPDKILIMDSSSHVKVYKRFVFESGMKIDAVRVDELTTCDSLKFDVELSVINIGSMDGSHVVLLFSALDKDHSGAPKKQLIGFTRVHTKSHGATKAVIKVDTCNQLSFANDEGMRILPLGVHNLILGGLVHHISIEM